LPAYTYLFPSSFPLASSAQLEAQAAAASAAATAASEEAARLTAQLLSAQAELKEAGRQLDTIQEAAALTAQRQGAALSSSQDRVAALTLEVEGLRCGGRCRGWRD
jgi:hypothetical protein